MFRRLQCRLGCAPTPFSSIGWPVAKRSSRKAAFNACGASRAIGVGEAPARGRRRLEAAVAPAGIEIEAVDRRLVDDRRAVHGHVHQAAPAAQQPQPAEHRHQRHAALAHVLDGRQVAALGVGIVAVDVAAEHQPALVGLADVEMPGAERDDVSISGLTPSETKACSTWLSIGSRRPARAATREELPAQASPILPARDEARARVDADDAAALDADARDLAVLHDVDAALVGRAGIAPRHGVMPHGSAAALQQAALDRESARCRNRDRAASRAPRRDRGIRRRRHAAAWRCRAAQRRRAGRRNDRG